MFALIVDTGSTVTYVPCSSCEQCGRHQVILSESNTHLHLNFSLLYLVEIRLTAVDGGSGCWMLEVNGMI